MQKLLDAVVLWVVNLTRDAIALTAEFYLLTKKKSIMDAMVYLTFMETTGSDRKAFEQRIAQLLPQCTTHKDFEGKSPLKCPAWHPREATTSTIQKAHPSKEAEHGALGFE